MGYHPKRLGQTLLTNLRLSSSQRRLETKAHALYIAEMDNSRFVINKLANMLTITKLKLLKMRLVSTLTRFRQSRVELSLN